VKTVRDHEKGKPFTRDIPAGCKARSRWEKEGFILKADAFPQAWILMADNCHEFAVFDAGQVEPGIPQKPRVITAVQLERAFKQYELLVPNAELMQDDGIYWIEIYLGMDDEGYIRSKVIKLSGSYDRSSGRVHRGSRLKALEKLKELIAELEKQP
jgi:hypothetical protein